MEFGLLVEFEVMQFVQALPRATRARVSRDLLEIGKNPHASSEYQEWDKTGRLHDVCIREGLAIHYWIDSADRHVKVMAMRPADR
jgi:hypothetical protein